MTNINYDNNRISVTGHANYEEHGKDIVCAAISTATQFFINLTQCDFDERDGEYNMKVDDVDHNTIQTYLDMMKALSNQYPNHLQVSRW